MVQASREDLDDHLVVVALRGVGVVAIDRRGIGCRDDGSVHGGLPEMVCFTNYLIVVGNANHVNAYGAIDATSRPRTVAVALVGA
ncbi:hypothetical protein [Microtetraspora niveoalba]|uniref:hypothetical protein n=1 Tax=Microtetraspora niveoalba TaxID=46175 RepID=UPI0014722772|nr:hypothetical protein [Microtetraspora niveoalba]